jgi:hypothetical protein
VSAGCCADLVTHWGSLFLAVDREGATIDFYFSEQREEYVRDVSWNDPSVYQTAHDADTVLQG